MGRVIVKAGDADFFVTEGVEGSGEGLEDGVGLLKGGGAAIAGEMNEPEMALSPGGLRGGLGLGGLVTGEGWGLGEDG